MQWKGPSIEYDILGISSGFLTCYLLESINTFLTPPPSSLLLMSFMDGPKSWWPHKKSKQKRITCSVFCYIAENLAFSFLFHLESPNVRLRFLRPSLIYIENMKTEGISGICRSTPIPRLTQILFPWKNCFMHYNHKWDYSNESTNAKILHLRVNKLKSA